MKKTLFIFLFFICLFLFSCDHSDDSSDNDGSKTDNPNENKKLDVPVLSIDEETGVVTWSVIADATHYNYIINGNEVKSTTQTTLTIENESTISVQAVNEETQSDWSYAVTNYDTSDIYEEYIEDVYVKFHKTNLAPIKIKSGEKIEEPEVPLKENCTFDNWYKDPYYLEEFDFNQPINSNTIVYANYIENSLISDTYFWIKGSPKMSANIMSGGTGSNWHFIPLKVNQSNIEYKEFVATVTVTGASVADPCYYLIMDGFSDDSGRTYWKNNTTDFKITSDGIYNIYFSLEHEYASGIHSKYSVAINSAADIKYKNKITLDTPVISVDSNNNLAVWESIGNADSYEVIIDNGDVIKTTDTSINLEKGSHITVRAINSSGYSNWSLPKANINHIILVPDDNVNCSVYFVGFAAYQVKLNDSVSTPNDPVKVDFTFGGWFLDPACCEKAQFPYEIKCNTVFYPKWIPNADYKTKTYYNLTLLDGTIIKGFTWNLDNYTFDEYETGVINLNANTEYYVVSTSNTSIKYGPYKVASSGNYKLYFSEENLWNDSNLYIESTVRTIYFSNKNWSDTVYAYVWNGNSGKYMDSWPGVEMVYVETNSYGEKVYKIDVDLNQYDHIIFTHGSNGVQSGSQTVDIDLLNVSANGFYLKDKNSSGKYEYGTYSR